MGILRHQKPEDVQAITSAPPTLAADQARRQRRYLTQMGIRVVCFLGAVLAWPHLPIALAITLVVAATVLPYIAVLGANAGRERRPSDPDPVARELPAGPTRDALEGSHE